MSEAKTKKRKSSADDPQFIVLLTEAEVKQFKEGLHVAEKEQFFKIQRANSLCRHGNWANRVGTRFYAQVTLPPETTVTRERYWSCLCDRMILSAARPIWEHPMWNIRHYVTDEPELLSVVPPKLLPESLLLELVEERPGIIWHLPKSVFTSKIVATALAKDYQLIMCWKIPQELITQEMANEVCAEDPTLLSSIPERLRTPQLERAYEEYSELRSSQGP